MAQNENALGAPTEGLGQTVTFALKGIDNAPQIDALGPARISADIQGGQGAALELQGSVVKQPDNSTMALLTKIAGAALAPQMEKARRGAFLSGMQKARAGAALLDIAEEQPWYSKIFGESDVVAGARAFTQQTKAQETVLALQEQMPELRKRGLDEARAVMSSAVDKAMTGDAETDMFLMNSFTRTLPSLMATHAREHYKYTQEQAVETHGKMLGSGARVLQEQANEHFTNSTDPLEYDIAKAQYLGLVAQPAGMEDDSYHKALTQHIVATAENGDFHAIRVLREAGAIDMLPEKVRSTVLRTIDVNERQLPAGPQGDAFAERLYGLRQMAHQIRINEGPVPDPEVLRREYADLNTDWMRVTGSSRPMVNKATVTGEAVQMADEIQQAMDRDHRERVAAAKEAAREAKLNKLLALQQVAAEGRSKAADTAWNMANPASLLFGADKFKEDEINSLISTQMSPLLMKPGALTPSEEQQYFRLGAFMSVGAGDNMVKAILAPMYQVAKTSGNVATPQFAAVYDNYLRMKKVNPLALGKMFDEQTLKELNLFNAQHPNALTRDGAGNPQISLSAAGAFSSSVDPNTKLPKMTLDKKDADVLVKQIVKEQSFWRPEMLGGAPDISSVQANRVAARMSANVEALLPTVGGNVELAMKQAWASFDQQGGRVVGGYEVTDRSLKGRSMRDVLVAGRDSTIVFGDEPDVIGKGFAEYVKQRAETVGMERPEDAEIMPTGDGQSFTILGYDRKGERTAIPGSYSAVGDLLNKKRKDKELHKLTLGVPTTEADYKAGVKLAAEDFKKKVSEGK
jgi:hypothetical protein